MNKKAKNIVLMLLVCVVLVVLSATITTFVTSQSSKSENAFEKVGQEDTKLQILSSVENNEWIVVETTYGKFCYPRAFMDVMAVETAVVSGEECLKFMSEIDGISTVVYTIYYDSNEGVLCGHQVLPNDEEVNVSVVFEDAPAKISDDWKTTFYAVQETFNDVIVSMAEDSRFTAVE